METGAGVFCGDSRAHSVDGNATLNDSSPFTELVSYPCQFGKLYSAGA